MISYIQTVTLFETKYTFEIDQWLYISLLLFVPSRTRPFVNFDWFIENDKWQIIHNRPNSLAHKLFMPSLSKKTIFKSTKRVDLMFKLYRSRCHNRLWNYTLLRKFGLFVIWKLVIFVNYISHLYVMKYYSHNIIMCLWYNNVYRWYNGFIYMFVFVVVIDQLIASISPMWFVFTRHKVWVFVVQFCIIYIYAKRLCLATFNFCCAT